MNNLRYLLHLLDPTELLDYFRPEPQNEWQAPPTIPNEAQSRLVYNMRTQALGTGWVKYPMPIFTLGPEVRPTSELSWLKGPAVTDQGNRLVFWPSSLPFEGLSKGMYADKFAGRPFMP